MGHIFPWATKEYILDRMTAPQVDLYFKKALKLLGQKLYLFVDAPRKFLGGQPGLDHGVTHTRLEPSSFSSNEEYERVLKSFGGKIKRG